MIKNEEGMFHVNGAFCKNGFEHHVALVRADVAGVIEEALDSYLGWDLYVHE